MKFLEIGGHYINPNNVVEIKHGGKVENTTINKVDIVFNFSTGTPPTPFKITVNSDVESVLKIFEKFN